MQHVSESVWRAHYGKPRHEKKDKERLKETGFSVFGHLIRTKVLLSDRWKLVHKPAAIRASARLTLPALGCVLVAKLVSRTRVDTENGVIR